jgi:hypothetical protein
MAYLQAPDLRSNDDGTRTESQISNLSHICSVVSAQTSKSKTNMRSFSPTK